MVNTFFDEINKMSDHFTYNFVEYLKQDMDNILTIIQQSATEQSTYFTFMTIMLRRLSPIDGAFANTLLHCKQLIQRLNNDAQMTNSPQFTAFFEKHLFRSYCSLIKECPNKRQQLCELIYAHSAHDMQLRIRVVQNLKKYLRDDELVYCCQANML